MSYTDAEIILFDCYAYCPSITLLPVILSAAKDLSLYLQKIRRKSDPTLFTQDFATITLRCFAMLSMTSKKHLLFYKRIKAQSLKIHPQQKSHKDLNPCGFSFLKEVSTTTTRAVRLK
ncbi:hypothetical protein [Pseudocnuella soli]|uniref:hypothetical protein n=1 Tax=Pseudocnuella soli TaxID=2502779 RepID=UPI00104D4F7B|nr:hypothetical protein [Pseudocnuella soli]